MAKDRKQLTVCPSLCPIVFMSDVPLWILIGLPGSGKSTWAERFVQGDLPLLMISTDQIRAQLYGDAATQGAWPQIWQRVQQRFRYGAIETQQGKVGGVLYDATNTRRRWRREIIQTAREIGYNRVLALWFDIPLACCVQRNHLRSRQVPLEVIHTMSRQLAGAPPHCDEGFDAVFQIRI
ncbi:MAG: AAA family ATPase [Leptolyngbya sp. SIO1E4]|nr:AAA family ATPase [Leptolyngbya sp. SIO1E4]